MEVQATSAYTLPLDHRAGSRHYEVIECVSFLFLSSRMQRCEQSGVLPAGAEVQVLQSCVLQTDVLQDLPGPLTSHPPTGCIEPGEKKKKRQRLFTEGGSSRGSDTDRPSRWKKLGSAPSTASRLILQPSVTGGSHRTAAQLAAQTRPFVFFAPPTF